MDRSVSLAIGVERPNSDIATAGMARMKDMKNIQRRKECIFVPLVHHNCYFFVCSQLIFV